MTLNKYLIIAISVLLLVVASLSVVVAFKNNKIETLTNIINEKDIKIQELVNVVAVLEDNNTKLNNYYKSELATKNLSCDVAVTNLKTKYSNLMKKYNDDIVNVECKIVVNGGDCEIKFTDNNTNIDIFNSMWK